LRKEFTIIETTDTQAKILSIPWHFIITTNYDSAIEISIKRNARYLVKSATLSDNIKNINDGSAKVCLHLNGYIERLNEQTINDEFKLTSRSYDRKIDASPWMSIIRDEIRFATVVFFVGYSMYDIDVRRLLVANRISQDKCIFIQAKDLDKVIERRLSLFGDVVKIDSDGFASRIDKITASHSPVSVPDKIGNAFHEYKLPVGNRIPASASDFYNLLFLGNYSFGFNADAPYLLDRESTQMLFNMTLKGSCLIIHSYVGNGKSLLLDNIAAYASVVSGQQGIEGEGKVA
jgi:hypothetical protein